MGLSRTRSALLVLHVCMLLPLIGEQAQAGGRQEKLRVLVDKVLARESGWKVTDKVIEETKAAGFNVYVPRHGAGDPEQVRHVADLAQKHGIRCMTWLRGTVSAKKGCQLVWKDGQTQGIYSPNADELWEWMSKLILMHASVSRDFPALMGVFLDYEIYSKPWLGWAYPLSYDEQILNAFAKAKGFDRPKLDPKDRHTWLVNSKLHGAFEEFQVASWRERCRKLRGAIDKVNPKFRFCVYPGPRSPFINQAIMKEWATEAAPLIFASCDTYGRPQWWAEGPPKPHAEALDLNRKALLRDVEFLMRSAIPHQYMGGIDPAVRGADPEFAGKNAVMISEVTDGYWIFYEGPRTGHPDHPRYWDWFARANHSIARQDFALWKQPREGTDLFDSKPFTPQTDRTQVGVFNLPEPAQRLLEQTGRFEVTEVTWVSSEHLKPFDVVILESYTYEPWRVKRDREVLKAYVEAGGALLLTHDSAALLGPIFKEVAVVVPDRDHGDACGRLRGDRMVTTEASHTALGLRKGRRFAVSSATYWAFQCGPHGSALATDVNGLPVCVIGAQGKGNLAYLGWSPGAEGKLKRTEAKLFLGLVEWLVQRKVTD